MVDNKLLEINNDYRFIVFKIKNGELFFFLLVIFFVRIRNIINRL